MLHQIAAQTQLFSLTEPIWLVALRAMFPEQPSTRGNGIGPARIRIYFAAIGVRYAARPRTTRGSAENQGENSGHQARRASGGMREPRMPQRPTPSRCENSCCTS